MSAPLPAPAPQPAVPPMLLALRFVAALGVLGVGQELLWDNALRLGWIEPPTTEAALVEGRMLVLLLACAATVAFAAWQRPGLPWRPVRARLVLARYLPFAVVWLGVLVVYLQAMHHLGSAVPPQPTLRHVATGDTASAGWWLAAATPVLGAPIAEEIVFRGYLQPALLGAMRPLWAIGITAAVFGAAHSLPYALPTAMLGGLFGWLAFRTGALWPAVLAHTVHNGLTVAATACWPAHLELLYPR